MKNKPLVGISDNYGEEGWHNLKVEYVSALAAAASLRLCDCRFTEPVFVGSGGVSSELVSGFQRGR